MVTKKKKSGKHEYSNADIKKLLLALIIFFGMWITTNIVDVQNYLVNIGVWEETVVLIWSFFVYAYKTFRTNYSDGK